MTTLQLAYLEPATHSGKNVEINGRQGRLSWGRNPAYRRLQIWQWYLIIPNDRFGSVAMSLEATSPEAKVVFK